VFLPLTESYIANKFFQNCGKPYYNKLQKVYQGSCPICREGNSWLKKRRCYYIVEKSVVCCHNCGWYSSPYNWIVKVTGLNFKEIKKDLENTDNFVLTNNIKVEKEEVKKTESLPSDSINLFDSEQTDYYKQNHVVTKCLELIKSRKLDTAVNRPQSLFVSLKDKVHENRLIVPFYDDNKIIFYQTRTVIPDENRPKYLSKVGSEKSLYGINNISANIEYIFITEGPIDAMFIQNGVAVAGINESKTKNFTDLQQRQLAGFPLHKKIWVLDNQWNDNTSKIKTKNLLDIGETVFLWPEFLKQYKDINEYCIDKNFNSFDIETIKEYSYNGLRGKLLLANY
jgi:hypothetical protein